MITRITFAFLIFASIISYSQPDSISNNRKLIFNPSFHGIQIDGSTIYFIYQYGGQIDFDLFRSKNNYCVGTRFNYEKYYMGDFGGTTLGSPFTNYNLYARLSNTKDLFSSSFLVGVTYYTTNRPEYIPNEYMIRFGFEVKYGHVVALIFKGSTSAFKEKTSFIGL